MATERLRAVGVCVCVCLVLCGCAADPAADGQLSSSGDNAIQRAIVHGVIACEIPQNAQGEALQRGERYSAPSLNWLLQAGWETQEQQFESASFAQLILKGNHLNLREQTALLREDFRLSTLGVGRRFKVSMQVKAASERSAQINWAVFSDVILEAFPELLPMRFALPISPVLGQEWQTIEGVYDSVGYEGTFLRLQSEAPFEYKNIHLDALGDSPSAGNMFFESAWRAGLVDNSDEKLLDMMRHGWEVIKPSGFTLPLDQKYLDNYVWLQWPILDAVTAQCNDTPSLSKHIRLLSPVGYKGGYQTRMVIDGAVPAGLRLQAIVYFPMMNGENKTELYLSRFYTPNVRVNGGSNEVVFDVNPGELPDSNLWVESPFTEFKVKSIAIHRIPAP